MLFRSDWYEKGTPFGQSRVSLYKEKPFPPPCPILANIETLPRDAQSVMGRRKASVMRVKQATGNELAQMGNNSRSKSYLPLYISLC